MEALTTGLASQVNAPIYIPLRVYGDVDAHEGEFRQATPQEPSDLRR